jgi:hypothetical protein
MSEKPKRPWFRFHLLTAVLMMFITGLYLGLCIHVERNLPMKFDASNFDVEHFARAPDVRIVQRDGFVEAWPNGPSCRWRIGWPYPFYEYADFPGMVQWQGFRDIFWVEIPAFVVVLLTVAFVSESLIRRREDRKP